MNRERRLPSVAEDALDVLRDTVGDGDDLPEDEAKAVLVTDDGFTEGDAEYALHPMNVTMELASPVRSGARSPASENPTGATTAIESPTITTPMRMIGTMVVASATSTPTAPQTPAACNSRRRPIRESIRAPPSRPVAIAA